MLNRKSRNILIPSNRQREYMRPRSVDNQRRKNESNECSEMAQDREMNDKEIVSETRGRDEGGIYSIYSPSLQCL